MKHKELGIVSPDYFLNHYNSLENIDKRNLNEFLKGLNNKAITNVSNIKTHTNGYKYIIVKYKYGQIETISDVWYMPGMKKLIQLAAKFDFQLDLQEIVKQAYK